MSGDISAPVVMENVCQVGVDEEILMMVIRLAIKCMMIKNKIYLKGV
jgi:hypothetical protein